MAFTLNRKKDTSQMDTNQDGKIDEQEAADVGISQEEFNQADTDNSGDLDSSEIKALPDYTKPIIAQEKQLAEPIEPITINGDMDELPGYRNIDAQVEFPEEESFEVPWRKKPELPYFEEPEDYIPKFEVPYGFSPLKKKEEEKEDWGVQFIPGSGVKTPSTATQGRILDQMVKATISWDDTKDILQKLGGGNNVIGASTLDGIQTDDFNPEVENPSYSTGHEIEPPETGVASSTSGPEGSTMKLFKDIMSGAKNMEVNMPSTPNKVGSKTTSTLNKMSRNKKNGEPIKTTGTPLKLANKNSITQGKENIYERIIDKVQKNYLSWPLSVDGESHVKEKGVVAVYARRDWISVKYGSYRKTLLDTFAQEHPQFLPQILEVVNS